MTKIPNAITFDIEDYFHAFTSRNIPVKKKYLDYKDKGTNNLLKILKNCKIKATFFVLGDYAKKHPDLIRKITENGHEIGVHSYKHINLRNLSAKEFKKDLGKAKRTVEKITGEKVLGYRAPFFSFDEKNQEYTKAFTDLGFAYDSSTNPILKALHGHPGYNPRFHEVSINNSKFTELPLASFPIFGHNLPWAGGFYFRLMPYYIFKLGLRYINNIRGPSVLYLHNWEFDPNQPKIPGKLSVKFFHYVGLSTTRKKLEKLSKNFKLMPIRDLCKEIKLKL